MPRGILGDKANKATSTISNTRSTNFVDKIVLRTPYTRLSPEYYIWSINIQIPQTNALAAAEYPIREDPGRISVRGARRGTML
jgi:hypothetical protein